MSKWSVLHEEFSWESVSIYLVVFYNLITIWDFDFYLSIFLMRKYSAESAESAITPVYGKDVFIYVKHQITQHSSPWW